MKKIIGGIVVILLIILAINYGETNKNNDETIKIGVISPITGSGSSYGEPISKAVILAAEQINSAGGIGGKQIELIVEDGQCDAATAVNAANKLINQNEVSIILGGGCSTESLAIAPITNKNKVLQIAAATSNNDYTNSGSYSFRVMPKAKDIAGTIGIYANSLGIKKIAILHEQKEYPLGVVQSFTEGFESAGGMIVTTQSYSPDETDLRTHILKLAETDAEAVLFSSQDEKGSIVFYQQLSELGLNDRFKNFFHDWTGLTNEVFESSNGLIANQSFSVAAYVDPNSQKVIDLKRDYNNRFGEDYNTADLWPTSSYDRLFLVKKAIESCSNHKDTDCLRLYLHDSVKEWEGTMGKISFDENGDIETEMYTQYFNKEGVEVRSKIEK